MNKLGNAFQTIGHMAGTAGQIVGVIAVKGIINPTTALFYAVTNPCIECIKYDRKARKLLNGDIQILKDIPKNQQYRLANSVNSLIFRISGYNKPSAIAMFSTLPANKRESFINSTMQLLTNIKSEADRSNIITIINRISCSKHSQRD